MTDQTASRQIVTCTCTAMTILYIEKKNIKKIHKQYISVKKSSYILLLYHNSGVNAPNFPFTSGKSAENAFLMQK